ncbi:MAG: hypothetical protein M3511_05170 [Deinococcota bacterium]|jgi:serine/threonine-protein kinase RIO1|nr:hypothetical protein [Deinococcota bacterium]
MNIIDAHQHVNGDHPNTLAFLERKKLKLLNICVAVSNDRWCTQEGEPYKKLAQQYPEHSLCLCGLRS